MPLSPDEIEKIKETESLREDIRKTLRPPERSRLSDFQRQLVMLFLGFLLTSVVGGVLTFYWKKKESDNQRTYLAARQNLEKQYAVMNSTAQEVATTVAAVDDVLSTYYDNEWSQTEIDERRKNWNSTSRTWRIKAELLNVEIDSAFSDTEINALFQQLVHKRTVLGNMITNLPRSKDKIAADKTLARELDAANTCKGELVDLLKKCCAAMTAAVRQGTSK